MSRGVFKNPKERAEKISKAKRGSLKSTLASIKAGKSMGEKNKGRRFTKEHILRLSKKVPWNKGLKASINKTVKRIAESISGDKSNLWRGGKSKELYGFEWTNLLKH